MEARWQAVIDEARVSGSSHKQKAIYDAQPREFWVALLDEYVSPSGIKTSTGISTETSYRFLRRFGIAWDSTPGKPLDQKRIERWLDEFEGEVDELCETYEVPELPTDKTWLILSDLHVPTVSITWFRRAMAVACAYQCDAVAVFGDFGNYDAISRFALKDRGIMPRLQEEVRLLRKVVHLFEECFAGNSYIMISNHERRLVGALKHELDADDLFESLLHGGKWVDSDHCAIGDIWFVHPPRGRKVLSSQANEFSLSNEHPVFVAHSHRFFTGYSNACRPIGMLGGLFDKERLHYYMKRARYVNWTNGFFVLKGGLMLPFADGFVDWGQYGTE